MSAVFKITVCADAARLVGHAALAVGGNKRKSLLKPLCQLVERSPDAIYLPRTEIVQYGPKCCPALKRYAQA